MADRAPDLRAAATRTLAAEEQDALDFTTVRGFIPDGIPALVDRRFAHDGVRPVGEAAAVARFRAR